MHQAFDFDLAEHHPITEGQSVIVFQVHNKIRNHVLCGFAVCGDALVSHWDAPLEFIEFLRVNVVLEIGHF